MKNFSGVISGFRLIWPVTLLFLAAVDTGAVAQLKVWEDKLPLRVQIGMSPQEVKNAIGNPDQIEAGFPQPGTGKLIHMPMMNGEARFSTWFYYYPTVFEDELRGGDTTFTLNGTRVSHDLFEKYRYRTSVYFYNDSLISPDRVTSNDLWRDPSLRIVEKETIQEETAPPRIVQVPYRPVLSVTFDGITGVVSSRNVFFKQDFQD